VKKEKKKAPRRGGRNLSRSRKVNTSRRQTKKRKPAKAAARKIGAAAKAAARKVKTLKPGKKVKTFAQRLKKKPLRASVVKPFPAPVVKPDPPKPDPPKPDPPKKCPRAEPHCLCCTKRPKEKEREKYDFGPATVKCRNCGYDIAKTGSGKGGEYYRHCQRSGYNPQTRKRDWKPCTEK
jgi:hypothetical protein